MFIFYLSFFLNILELPKKLSHPKIIHRFFSPRIAPWACVVKISLSALVVIFCPHIHWAPWTKVVGWWSLDCTWRMCGSIPKVLDPSPFRWKHTPDPPKYSDTPKFGPQKKVSTWHPMHDIPILWNIWFQMFDSLEFMKSQNGNQGLGFQGELSMMYRCILTLNMMYI